jgi:type I restriction enzyme, S subunit
MIDSPYISTPLRDVLDPRSDVVSWADFPVGNMRIISKISFKDGQLHFREPDGRAPKTDLIIIQPGDLVISGINATQGAIAIYDPAEREPLAASIHYSAYRVKNGKADTSFIWWLLRSNLFRNTVATQIPGGIKSELRPSRLMNVVVPMPDFTRQVEISDYLSRALLEITRVRQIHNFDTKALSGLMEACIHGEMSQFGNLARFEEVVTLRPRSGPAFQTSKEWSGERVIMPSAVTGFKFDMSKTEYTIGGERISQKDRLEEGDLLIARGNKREQVGNAAIVPTEAAGLVCANLLMRTTLDLNVVDPEFCVYWLRSPQMRDLVRRSMKGTNPNIQKINQKTILAYPFPKDLEIEVQRAVVRRLRTVEERIQQARSLHAEAELLAERLMDSIVSKVLHGGM